MKTFKKLLNEIAIVRMDRYQRSHGKAYRSDGQPANFMFTNKDFGDVDYNNAKEVFQFKGTWKEAQKEVKKWAKENNHVSTYLLP